MTSRTFSTGAEGSGVGYDFKPPPAANTEPYKSVAVFGHSYAHHLFPTVHHTTAIAPSFSINLQFAVAEWRVSARLNLGSGFSLISQGSPFSLLEETISGDTEPRELAKAIETLALEKEEATGGNTFILSLENRLKPRGLTSVRYKSIKNGVNRWLRKILPAAKPRFRPVGVMDEHLGPDGVHLNEAGNQALLNRMIELAEEWNRSQQTSV